MDGFGKKKEGSEMMFRSLLTFYSANASLQGLLSPSIPTVIFTAGFSVITVAVMTVSVFPVTAVMPAVLNITISPEIIPATASYFIGKITLPNDIPRSAVV